MDAKEIMSILNEIEEIKDYKIDQLLSDNAKNHKFTSLYKRIFGKMINCASCNGEVHEAFNKIINLNQAALESLFSQKYRIKKDSRIEIWDHKHLEVDGETVLVGGIYTPTSRMTDKVAKAIIKHYPSLRDKFEIKHDEELFYPEIPQEPIKKPVIKEAAKEIIEPKKNKTVPAKKKGKR